MTSLNYPMFIDDDYWTTLKPKQISPLLHILSTKSAYKSLCHEIYGDYPWPDRCALVHAFAFPHDFFDNFDHPVKPWASPWSLRRLLTDYGITEFSAELIYSKFDEAFNVETQLVFTMALKLTGYVIAALGMLLYYQGYALPKS